MKNVDVIVGGQWGSEGKGNIVSAIASDYEAFIRTGGPNAGHQVKLDGKAYTFHHLPSGSLHNQHATIILGPGTVINPARLMEEIETMKIRKDRIFIDPRAAIIDEQDIEKDRRMFAHIGSTAQGVGSATIRKIQRAAPEWIAQEHDIVKRITIAHDCHALKDFICDTLELIEDIGPKPILLEGTQGTLLSLHHGDWPYVTSRDTTIAGCLSESGIAPARIRRTIMVVRTFPIRVQSPNEGTSGPMGEEITWEDVALTSGIPVSELKEREKTSTTKRQRRVAKFHFPTFRRAIALNQPTDLALTFADYLGSEDNVHNFINMLEGSCQVPITFVSRGFGPECVEIRDTMFWPISASKQRM